MKHIERMNLVVRPVCKTGSGRITPLVAGSIPALSAILTDGESRDSGSVRINPQQE